MRAYLFIIKFILFNFRIFFIVRVFRFMVVLSVNVSVLNVLTRCDIYMINISPTDLLEFINTAFGGLF